MTQTNDDLLTAKGTSGSDTGSPTGSKSGLGVSKKPLDAPQAAADDGDTGGTPKPKVGLRPRRRR